MEAPDWINVIPLLDDGRVVMVRQWRYGVQAPTLEIPGGMVDPGDMRRFTMSGSVFFPVNLTPDGVALDASQGDGDTDITAGAGGASDYLALKKDVDDIKTMIDEIKTDYNAHTHVVTTDAPATGTAAKVVGGHIVAASYTPTYSKNVKVERN